MKLLQYIPTLPIITYMQDYVVYLKVNWGTEVVITMWWEHFRPNPKLRWGP